MVATRSVTRARATKKAITRASIRRLRVSNSIWDYASGNWIS